MTVLMVRVVAAQLRAAGRTVERSPPPVLRELRQEACGDLFSAASVCAAV